jgi:hypothetical protein
MERGKRIKIGYKIVSRADYPGGKKCSGYISGPDLCVTYKVGKFARANHSAELLGFGLTYFEAQPIAKNYMGFMGENSGKELWECEVKGDMKLPPYKFNAFLSLYTWGAILGLMEEIKNCATERSYYSPWPLGTKMCRQIKLTRRIE